MASDEASDADLVADHIAQAVQFFGASASGSKSDRSELRRIEAALRRAARTTQVGSYEHGQLNGILAIVTALKNRGEPVGLAVHVASIEPGSLPERLLLEISRGVHGANADLADRLGTDHWQISRAGRRLRDLGLAERTRAGRLNVWTLTHAGELEVRRHRPRPR